MRQFTILFLFAALTIFPLTAVPLAFLLDHPSEDYPLGETVRWEGDDAPLLALLPNVPGAQAVTKRFFAFKPEITVERFFRMDLPPKYALDTSAGRRLLFTDIVNSFGNPDTQVGYTYHSATKKREVVFLKKSYISNRQGRRQDPIQFTPFELPSQISYYQFIDEAMLSGSVFRQTLVVGDSFLNSLSINENQLWFGIFPVIGSRDIRNELLAFIHDNQLYLYSCTQLAKEPMAKKLGLPLHLPSMFTKRMDVIARWLGDQLANP